MRNLVAVCALLFALSCQGATPILAFLRTQGSARIESMGGVTAGIDGDINSVFGNPAALSVISGYEFAFSHYEYYGGIRHETASAVSQLGNGTTLGLSVVYINNGEQERRDIFGVQDGSFTPFQVLPTLSFAKSVSKGFSLGANVKVPYENIDNYSSAKVVFDLAAFIEAGEGLSVGVNFQNFGLYSDLPVNIKAGFGYSAGILSGGLDCNYETGQSAVLGLGLEGAVVDGFCIRAGMKYDMGETFSLINSMSFGFGVKIDPIRLDYAFKMDESLGNAHFVTISIKLP